MQTMKAFVATSLALTMYLCVTAAMTAYAPIRWLDAKMVEKGEDPESGAIGTLEIVILASIILVAVLGVAALISGRIGDFADRIPSP